jgi:hypothetical protein
VELNLGMVFQEILHLESLMCGKIVQDDVDLLLRFTPSRPGELHPEALTDPDVSLATYPARATQ